MSDGCPRCAEYEVKGKLYCGSCGRYLGEKQQGLRETIDECPSCVEFQARGKSFCGVCGRYLGEEQEQQTMPDECPRCAEFKTRGKTFCGACGRYLGGPERDPGQSSGSAKRSSLLEHIILAVTIVIMAIAVFEAITLMINFPDVSSILTGGRLNLILIVPFPVAVYSISGFVLQLYWALIAMVIIVCVIIAIQKLVIKARGPGGITGPGAAEDTAAFWVCISLSAMLLINIIVTFLTMASGSDVNVPDFGDEVEQMFGMANAAFWEEIIARVLYIGIPMVFISLIVTKKKESLKCLFGGFGMSKTAIVLIIISGIIFGLAHYPGWDDQLWKVVTAGLMGIFLGYIFVRFGLYASILLHFINDYLLSFTWMGMDGLLVIVTFLLLGAGFVALIYILMRALGSKEAIKTLPLFKNGFVKNEDDTPH
ncbi:MAG: CPBP family glutamic-type intramembrane protease [Methanomassiliicoccaceae archaeon]|nr:CPBP family glutamic-type intramembrane protease [Methanomassiliicoccaceae archaeon]